MSTYVDQTDLESMFTPERVAEVFSVQAADGSYTGTVDATVLASCIRMGCAMVDRILMPVYDMTGPIFTAPYPDTLKQIAGIAVMHQGMLRRIEHARDPKSSPYYEEWKQAREDLKEIRESSQRLSKSQAPANVGGQIATSQPSNQRPFTFVSNPSDGTGGFNDGSF